MKKVLLILLLLLATQCYGQTRVDWSQIQNKPVVSMADFGGYPGDGVADDAAFASAAAAIAGGGLIVFDKGRYDFANSITLGSRMSIQGSGHGTILKFPTSNGITLGAGASYNIVKDFRIEGNALSTGILADPTLAYSDVRNVEIISFKIGMDLKKTINSSVSDVRIVSAVASSTGVIVGVASESALVPSVVSTTLTFNNVAVEGTPQVSRNMMVGIDLQNADTILLNQCTFQGCQIGLRLAKTTGSTGLARWITVVMPYFEANDTNISSLGATYDLIGPRSYGYSADINTKFTWVPAKRVSAQPQYFHGSTTRKFFKRNLPGVTSQTLSAASVPGDADTGTPATATVNYALSSEAFLEGTFPAVQAASGARYLMDIGYLSSDTSSSSFKINEPSLYHVSAQIRAEVASDGVVLLILKTNETFSDGDRLNSDLAVSEVQLLAGKPQTIKVSASWFPPPGAEVWAEFHNYTGGIATLTGNTSFSFFEIIKP